MRLLKVGHDGEVSLTNDLLGNSIPPYAILSHTWGTQDEEVVFKDLIDGDGKSKAGYDKIRFCAKQANIDGLQYIWVDTCCIDKTNNNELPEAINSMFRWYGDARRCYVYLSDISIAGHEQNDQQLQSIWELPFRNSRWFTRGWTLQELLAPESVEFFTREGLKLGDKKSLAQLIHEITGIAISALLGEPLSRFSVEERMKWAESRLTTREEDWAYSLWGRKHATRRLKHEIKEALIREEACNRLRVNDVRASEAAGTGPIPPRSLASQTSIEPVEDLSIVYFRKSTGQCSPHKFAVTTDSENELGRGSYGDVCKVKCTQCHEVYARKTIKFPPNTPIHKVAREKQMRDTDLELKCYMTLDHPHIIQYIHHELGEKKMQIYTEYCQYRDLEYFSAHQPHDKAHTDEIAWSFLEGLASALARCHHGLGALQINGVLSVYTKFEQQWATILHRDIKPGNVLLAHRNEPRELVLKLGDFGTSFKLEENGQLPSTQQAGTKIYWAPEIAEDAKSPSGKITKWSTKSDIWGVGAVMYRILTGTTPTRYHPEVRVETLGNLHTALSSYNTPRAGLLAQIVSECLDPSPDGRPSALQLLAVVVKSDTSPRGFLRSASFWAAMSMHTDPNMILSVTKNFITNHLSKLASIKTMFSPKEIAIIMSLVKIHCPEYLSKCHGQLCSGFVGDMAGSTVFHALACIGTKDKETIRFAIDESKWPESRDFLHLALKKNDCGLLPSTMAALQQSMPLCITLTKIEDQCRSEIADQILKNKLISHQSQQETTSAEEFDFMFKMLTNETNDQFIIPASYASKVMIETAQRGYSNVVRKLVEIGIQPSIRGKHNQTALHLFAHNGNVSMIQFLLDHKAEIDARDGDFRTPLHWAAWNGKHAAVRLLLRRRADVNAKDRHDRTPLYGAAGGGHGEVVRLLVFHKADKSIRGGTNKETPLERAAKRGQRLVIRLLNGVDKS